MTSSSRLVSFSMLAIFFGAGTASAATLPIEHGFYVLEGVECRDAPLAALFEYKDNQFSYPHAAQCRSEIAGQEGASYLVNETCSAEGDGTPARPISTSSRYQILSRTRLVVTKLNAGDQTLRAYRFCPSVKN